MNTHYALKAFGATVLMAAAGFANAAGQTTVEVTATVNGVCKFTATSMSAIAIGAIDPSTVAADPSNTGDITYHCTKGLTPSVTIASGGTSLSNGTDTLTYSFTLGAEEAGKGFSAAATATPAKVVATATIALADAQDAAAGDYTDTVTLEIDN